MMHAAKQFLAISGLTAILFASLVGICKETLTPCGTDCTSHIMAMDAGGSSASSCSETAGACAKTAADHMATFASLYPSVTADASMLVLLFAAAVVFVRLALHKDGLVDREILRAKTRDLLNRLAVFFRPNTLVFAFSQGILNAKIFA